MSEQIDGDAPIEGDLGVGASHPPSRNRSWRRRAVPYLLIAPALLYLALFFAYPMYEGLVLAVYDDDATLPLLDEPRSGASEATRLDQGTTLTILDRRGRLVEGGIDGDGAGGAGDALTEQWFRVTGDGVAGPVDGWVPETRIRVRDEAADGTPVGGTVRPILSETADPLTPVRDQPDEEAATIGQLDQRAAVVIADVAVLEVWFLVQAAPGDTADEGADGGADGGAGSAAVDRTSGWAPSRFLQIFDDGERGRVDEGTAGELTGRFIDKMTNDRFFGPALRTTLLLMVLIIPAQFVLAMAMALVIHARVRFSSGFLYVFSLPIGMSDLAVGILFFSIFTGNGMLNSILDGLGIIDGPQAFLTAETRNWIIFAIVLAELWRATSIVMVILVSGLQAIPDETLEAAELFGASYWQRIRHIMLPLLRPSIQVALILRTILAFQVFAVVVALSGGDVVTVLANETYRQYFEFRDDNVASAYALFILLLSIASAIFYLRSVRTQEQVRPS
ncbi:MAG: sugar ABC transporter permease [Actinomycetota bacterium]